MFPYSLLTLVKPDFPLPGFQNNFPTPKFHQKSLMLISRTCQVLLTLLASYGI